MDALFKLIKLFVMAMILIPLVWVASCTMLGAGAVMAVSEIADSDTVREAKYEAREDREARELREHNERINRESASRDRYDDYYYD